jgi:putative ABC transport system ATP-binding protein
VLEQLGLGDRQDTPARLLSVGQAQRVAIARALVNQPSVVFADEPTGSLDSARGKMVLDLLRDVRDKLGRTVVMVTHDAHAAERATTVLHLEKGVFVDGGAGVKAPDRVAAVDRQPAERGT